MRRKVILWSYLMGILSVSSLAIAQPTLDGKVDLGDYSLRAACFGEGTPTVIIEAGFSEAPTSHGTWASVVEEIAKTTRICIYDRLGLGSSDHIKAEKRTTQDGVDDLQNLLAVAHIEGPYILVGHSLGGFNVLMFTDQYPEDVVGVVLVDVAHPNQFDAFAQEIPLESEDDSHELKMWKRDHHIIPGLNNREKLDFLASMEQVRSVESLGDIPLVVLTRNPTCCIEPSVPLELIEASEQIWHDLHADLATLSTNSTHIVATKAGHHIHRDERQLVVDAILNIFSEVKK